MAQEIQLNNPATGEPDPELNLVVAMPRWAPGFDAGQTHQVHAYAIHTDHGPRVLFAQEIWNQ